MAAADVAEPAFTRDVTFLQGQVAYQTLKSETFNCEDLAAPGVATVIPFPGIGRVGLRPGGEIRFIGKEAVSSILDLHELGAPVYVTGPTGVGKSCALRAVAATLINQGDDKDKILCIWTMDWALYNLMDALQNALLFAYCQDETVCETIQQLATVEDVCGFMSKRRHLCGEDFFFIVDGAEGEVRIDAKHRKEIKAQLNKVLKLGRCCIYGVSPAATEIVDSSQLVSRYRMSLGFTDASYTAFMNTSVLGSLCQAFPEWKTDVDFYGGQHPLFLDSLDKACRSYAARIMESGQAKKRKWCFPTVVERPGNTETLDYLRDREDWDNVLQLFMGSSSLSTIASDCAAVVRRTGLSGVYNLSEMMAADRRFVLYDNKKCPVNYCTPYVRRLHIEGFREAERRDFKGGAWVPYCEYLLRNPTAVNWSEMGWLCEHLFSDALTHHGGMLVDGIHIQGNIRVVPFSSPPAYASWVGDLRDKVVDGIFFLPLECNLKAIDGALAFRDAQGQLHFFALQSTTNDRSHRRSIGEFMNLAVMERWIDFELKSSVWQPRLEWALHYTFVCLNKSEPVLVDPVLHRLPSGKYYGTAGYTLHTVTFEDAFRHTSLHETLQQVTMKREPFPVASSSGGAAGGTAGAAASVPESVLEEILGYSTRDKLETIAKDYGVDPSSHKKLKKAEFIRILVPVLQNEP